MLPTTRSPHPSLSPNPPSSSASNSVTAQARTTGNPFGQGIRRTPSHQPAGTRAGAAGVNGGSGGERAAGDDDDDSGDEVAKLVALSKRTLEVQEESVAASARALATARQAEQLGIENLVKVNEQGEQLDGIYKRTGEIQHEVKVAQARASYLDRLSDSFLKPVFGGEKKVKLPAASKENAAAAATAAGPDGRPLWGRRLSSLPDSANAAAAEPPTVLASRPAATSTKTAYLGEWADEEDRRQSEMHEKNIDENLSAIGGIVRGLKNHAMALGSAVDRQNGVLRATEDRVDESSERLAGVNRKVEKILNK
ncbi:Synaptosomal-associated protein 23 [Geranomyces variabilis]|uniref:Synaptosomal-associated protein 23 n=1 Tax=Geranomyces variabilis TaxID=109894 RepID=A0AAD5XKF3_9FUNG|nr:Synaptosomal-associated protein 23 [Geranomyces variabilis]